MKKEKCWYCGRKFTLTNPPRDNGDHCKTCKPDKKDDEFVEGAKHILRFDIIFDWLLK